MTSPRKAATNNPTVVESPELAAHVIAIHALGKQTIDNVIAIGARLTKCREIVGHGWRQWLEAEFKWTYKTADNFINIYKLAESRCENFSHLNLPVSALYLLAAPSTPEAICDEIISGAKAGKEFKVADVQAKVRGGKARSGGETTMGAPMTPNVLASLAESSRRMPTPPTECPEQLATLLADHRAKREDEKPPKPLSSTDSAAAEAGRFVEEFISLLARGESLSFLDLSNAVTALSDEQRRALAEALNSAGRLRTIFSHAHHLKDDDEHRGSLN
jgi:hypothetical protein